jgi:predicted MFS family arabinose efflux permease
VVTVPAISLTRGLRRKPLILTAIACLIIANTVTAISGNVPLSLASRFVAGAFCGIIWGMLAAYGLRISPPGRGGLALSIVSTGAPIGFALGTPLGAWLGTTFDWRWSFGGLTVLAVGVFLLIAAFVPDAPGQAATARIALGRVFLMPGIAVVLAVIFVWMLAHNTIYTYIAPFLRDGGAGLGPDLVLLVYGIASIGGVGVTAVLIDRHPRLLLHLSVALFVVAAIVLLIGQTSKTAVLAAAVLWGLTFGGASAQLQAALTRAGRDRSDVANSFLPVAFNLAIFAAGVTGALLLERFASAVLAVLMASLGLLALLLTFHGRRTAFTAVL